MAEPSSGAEHTKSQHEARDVRLGPIMLGGAILALVAAVALWAMAVLFDHLAGRRAELAPPPSPFLETGRLPPEPRLQVLPQADMRVMRAQENSLLGSYGWVDRQAGIVRIPIDRAMELLVDQAAKQGTRLDSKGQQP